MQLQPKVTPLLYKMMKIVKNPMMNEQQPQDQEPDEEEEPEEESKEEQDPNPTTAKEQTILENAWMTRSGRISKPPQVLNLHQSHLQADKKCLNP
jgi:hypothetical protein